MNNKIDVIPWDDNFNTGLMEIDEQHRKLVEIINQLAASFAFDASNIDLSTIFDELISYTHYHFSTEECIWNSYMSKEESAIKHKKTHDSFIQTLGNLIEEQQGKALEEVAENTLDFLVQWLVSHILESDRFMAYMVFAIQEGLKYPEAKACAQEKMSGHTRDMIDIVMGIYKILSRNTLQLMRKVTIQQKIERQLQFKERFLQTLIHQIPDMIVMKDEDGRFILANQAAAHFYGTTPEEMIGKKDVDFGVSQELSHALHTRMAQIIAKGKMETIYEDRQNIAIGEIRHFKSIKKPIQDNDGNHQLISITYDLTEEQKIKYALEQQTSFLKTLIKTIPDLVWVKNPEGIYMICNPRFEQLYGTTEEEIIGKSDYDFVHKELADFFREQDFIAVEKKASSLNEEWLTFVDGHKELVETTKTPMFDSKGHLLGVLGVARDITQRKFIEQQLHHAAYYDSLTKLPNRLLLSDRLEQAILHTKRHHSSIAVIYLDLDEFKAINDKFGHGIGDQALITYAQRLKQALREEDTLSRLGGDEFVIILQDIKDTQQVHSTLERLLQATGQSLKIDDLDLKISGSIGVTFYPQIEEIDADQLLRQSDQAMYQAKQLGKNRYHIFDPSHDKAMRTHYEKIEYARRGLKNQEFFLYYQPKVNMRTGKVIGVEALIRWQHPEYGFLSPGAFLPDLQSHPIMIELGTWVLEKAMQQIEDWHARGIHLPVSVNIDSMQLQQSDFVGKVQALLQCYQAIQEGDLEFEILETSALEDVALVAKIISQCRDLGIHFALDDFGTGYSSLTYLKKLPVKTLKIDRSFINDILNDSEDLAIIEGILELSRTFRKDVIAEGVESIVQGSLLLSMGCENAQGYAIAKPMSAEAIIEWSKQWSTPQEWSLQKNF